MKIIAFSCIALYSHTIQGSELMAEFSHFGEPLLSYVGMHYITLHYITLHYIILYYIIFIQNIDQRQRSVHAKRSMFYRLLSGNNTNQNQVFQRAM